MCYQPCRTFNELSKIQRNTSAPNIAAGALWHRRSRRRSIRLHRLSGRKRASLWQVLPLGPTGYGDSPYQCFSAFAGNTLLISPGRLVDHGLLSADDLSHAPRFPMRIDFGQVIEFKRALLERAFDNFKTTNDNALRDEFNKFCHENGWWLEDYALFRALKAAHGGVCWIDWEPRFIRRDEDALTAARDALREKIEAEKFYQYLFFSQWWALKAYCSERGIRIIGDAPIFVAYDSADVWSHPEMFKLDRDGRPIVIAGVPPDYFSRTGQLWGNPIYNWDAMRATGFRWWIDRLRGTLQTVDILRIDHFRGFAACWEIPGGDETAERGQWVDVPGRELFITLRNTLGELPIIAEDLGVITPDVEALARRLRISRHARFAIRFSRRQPESGLAAQSHPELHRVHGDSRQRHNRRMVSQQGRQRLDSQRRGDRTRAGVCLEVSEFRWATKFIGM